MTTFDTIFEIRHPDDASYLKSYAYDAPVPNLAVGQLVAFADLNHRIQIVKISHALDRGDVTTYVDCEILS